MHTSTRASWPLLWKSQEGARLGQRGVGAVIVRDGELLSTGCNEVTSSFDITAHAEAAASAG